MLTVLFLTFKHLFIYAFNLYFLAKLMYALCPLKLFSCNIVLVLKYMFKKLKTST